MGSEQTTETFSFTVVQHLVFIDGDAYLPETLTVTSGSTVTWVNVKGAEDFDSFLHDVTFTGGSKVSSPPLPLYSYWSFTFTTQGSYDYTDSIYSFMHGSVTVTG